MADRSYLIRMYDDVEPTHALCEKNLPDGEIWQVRGYCFIPPELAADFGEPDDTVTFGAVSFPAWRLSAEMPSPN